MHYLDDPATAITEAARALRQGGRLIIVDFAPHDFEFLRSEFTHRRLGLGDEEVAHWCEHAGLSDIDVRHLLPGNKHDAPQLTVSIWTAVQRRNIGAHYRMDAA